jgi:hypothetical protein
VAERKRESDSWPGEVENVPAAAGDDVPTSSAPLPEAEGVPDDMEGDEEPDTPDTEARSERLRTRNERSEVIPRGGLKPASSVRFTTPGRGSRGIWRRSRPPLRRVKRTLRYVDPVSVLKLSLFYYCAFVVLWLLFVAVLYTALYASGLVDRVERLGRLFVVWESLDISLWFVERWAFLIGLTCAVLASLVNLLLAYLYNLASDVVGGAEMTFIDRDI